MDVISVRTAGLGDAAYLLTHDGRGVLVDPQCDIERFTSLADANGVQIRYTLETHPHNDDVLYDVELLRAAADGLEVQPAEQVERVVGEGTAIDALLLARRPQSRLARPPARSASVSSRRSRPPRGPAHLVPSGACRNISVRSALCLVPPGVLSRRPEGGPMLTDVTVDDLDVARKAGLDVRNVVGGTSAWVRSGRAVETGAPRR